MGRRKEESPNVYLDKMNNSGIYVITSNINPLKTYIGSACNMRQRKNKHLSDLRRGIHTNSKLQNHYNKYGKEDLIFSVLLYCEKDNLIKEEQYFLDTLNPWFNISPTAGSSLGVKRRPLTPEEKERRRISSTGRKQTTETIELRKISLKAGAKKRGENISKSLKGRKLPQQTIDKIKASCTGRIQSPDSMMKASKTKTGKKLSPFHVEQIKKAKAGRSEEEIKSVNNKISESCKKAWVIRKNKRNEK